MSRKFLTPIDLNRNELQNAIAQNLGTAPSTPSKGLFYFDTVTDTLYIYDGTGWIPADARKATNIPNSALATNPLDRSNHTGTQTAATISNFDTQVRTSRLDQMAAPTSAVSMNSQKITGLATPTTAGDAAEYSWVLSQIQAAAAGLDVKNSVRAVSTSNITLSGTQTIDGVSVIAGDRVLVAGQSTASANGIYVVAAGAWSRSTDCNSATNYTSAAFTFVEEGTTYGASQWKVTTTGTFVIGSTSITWVQFGAGSTYTNGNGLDLAGGTFSVKPAVGGGISVGAGGVSVDTSVVARKYSQTFGDGVAVTFTITHNLGTQDVVVSVREVSTNAQVFCDVVNTSTTQITLTVSGTAPTSNSLRVTVLG